MPETENLKFRLSPVVLTVGHSTRPLEDVIRLSRRERIVLMCAETLPWRCHRSLVADALVIRGIGVEHLLSLNHHHPHSLTPFARAQGTRITYLPQK